MLYQLSYFRNFIGQRWIRTTEGVSQQIYSLPHLATLVFALFAFEEVCVSIAVQLSLIHILGFASCSDEDAKPIIPSDVIDLSADTQNKPGYIVPVSYTHLDVYKRQG